MQKQFIGKNREDQLEWLSNSWLKSGPPVCFLLGFSGVGKTDLARDLREIAEKHGRKPAVVNEIADRESPNILESLMELSCLLSQQGLPEMERVLFEETNPNPAFALEKVLRRPALIILDEAQRFFRRDSGSPLPEMKQILSHLRNRQDLPGRLLLLSDRIVEEARWSEWIPKRTLGKLDPDEAVLALNTKLKEADVDADISDERKQEVVRDLDYNPRAIEALVSALRYDSLDEIIEGNPGLWEVRDREVSREFLGKLEHDLLERTMRHLEDAQLRKLWRLAVHRRSFKREGLEQVCGSKDEAAHLRSLLVTRYLVNHYKGELALNPIVREISLSHLRDDATEFRQAHASAADYHLRHFKAKQIVGSHGKLGQSFAELRYHLVQSGRDGDLSDIGQRFTDHLKQQIKSVTPVPSSREELDERIAVLTVLLAKGGAKGLEYHLARCLQKRGHPGDVEEAILHARRALDNRYPEAWVLCGDLLSQSGNTGEAVTLLRQGIKVIPANKNVFSLYQICADVLSQSGKTDEAVTLLRQGIKVIPPDKGLFSLYQIGADLLSQSGKIDEAVTLLRQGIKVIPPDKGLFSLYQILGEVYCRAGRVADAILSLREGIAKVPRQFNKNRLVEAAIYLCLAAGDAQTLQELLEGTGPHRIDEERIVLGKTIQLQMIGDWLGAAEFAAKARQEFPTDIGLAGSEALSRLATGDAPAAWAALSTFPHLRFDRGTPLGWLATFIHLRRGAVSDALETLEAYLGRPVDKVRELDERFLLGLWDQQEASNHSIRLCFYIPLLPPSLTGQNEPARRLPFGPSVLPPQSLRSRSDPAPVNENAESPPEVYVSYAWGEDSTESGRHREEIVDRLCEAVRHSGRAIGRDKDRLRGGDSIERFAHEISKARRIVAVISKKSLHSEFCMVQELFRAFRRCDFQRGEFQEKVIAVVMDDAKPVLEDNASILSLAKAWQARLEELRTELRSVDPTRKSPSLWFFVDMMEEMCPRLPDMLGALKDIVMKMGFEEITTNQFREILDRLPPVD